MNSFLRLSFIPSSFRGADHAPYEEVTEFGATTLKPTTITYTYY